MHKKMISLIQKIFFVSIFGFLLTSFINNKYISSKEEIESSLQTENLHKLYKKCKEKDYFFCSMSEAIKYSLNSIKADLKSFPSSECIDKLCLRYENIYARDIICQDSDIQNKENQSVQIDERFLIFLTNCTFFITGSLYLTEEKNIIFNYNSFLSEIYFNKIYFYQNKISTKGELYIEFEYDNTYNEAFKYNKSDIIFNMRDTNLLAKMDNILKEIIDNYINVFISIIQIDENTKITQIKYLNEIINKYSKGYSLLDSNVTDDKNNITYIAYNEMKYDSFINIKNKLFIPHLYVTFEYALNYNITYNEGDLTFDNVTISLLKNDNEDYFGNINISAEFNNLIYDEEKYYIWNVINNDFYNNFENYK